jgi:hypothetical protein
MNGHRREGDPHRACGLVQSLFGTRPQSSHFHSHDCHVLPQRWHGWGGAAKHETAHDPQRPVQAQSAQASGNVSTVMAAGIASATEVGPTTYKVAYWLAIVCSVVGMIGTGSAQSRQIPLRRTNTGD